MGMHKKSRCMLILSMVIFSTIGILRKYIPLSSALVALVRAVVGTGFLLASLLLRKQRIAFGNLKGVLIPLILSGISLGFNWIFLFESYRYTSVATATLCYYLAPILVILVSPTILKEKLTGKQLLCAAAALAGIVLVSGITQESAVDATQIRGILFGLGAALLYASVMLLNKKLSGVDTYDKTILQLGIAACALLPYVLISEDLSAITVTPLSVILLLTAGILHTGIAYWLYFGAIPHLKGQTTALFSYIDPILAIVLSALILHEPMTPQTMIGAVLILGAAIVCEQ